MILSLAARSQKDGVIVSFPNDQRCHIVCRNAEEFPEGQEGSTGFLVEPHRLSLTASRSSVLSGRPPQIFVEPHTRVLVLACPPSMIMKIPPSCLIRIAEELGGRHDSQPLHLHGQHRVVASPPSLPHELHSCESLYCRIFGIHVNHLGPG